MHGGGEVWPRRLRSAKRDLEVESVSGMRDMRAYTGICNAALGKWDEAIVGIGEGRRRGGGERGAGVRAASVGFLSWCGRWVRLGSARIGGGTRALAGGLAVSEQWGPKGKSGLRGEERAVKASTMESGGLRSAWGALES